MVSDFVETRFQSDFLAERSDSSNEGIFAFALSRLFAMNSANSIILSFIPTANSFEHISAESTRGLRLAMSKYLVALIMFNALSLFPSRHSLLMLTKSLMAFAFFSAIESRAG